MSLDKIYELNEEAEKHKKEADAAYKQYNCTLKLLECEQKEFKKIVGVVDPKESFNLWNLIKEMSDTEHDYGGAFWAGLIFIILGLILLIVHIIPFLVFGTAGIIFLMVSFGCFWCWKRRKK